MAYPEPNQINKLMVLHLLELSYRIYDGYYLNYIYIEDNRLMKVSAQS